MKEYIIEVIVPVGKRSEDFRARVLGTWFKATEPTLRKKAVTDPLHSHDFFSFRSEETDDIITVLGFLSEYSAVVTCGGWADAEVSE